MKDTLFHFFGNLIEQSPIPTRTKFNIAFRLELFIFYLSHFNFLILRTEAEKRMSEDFVKYVYSNNIYSKPNKITRLKKGLDEQSIELIDKILLRQEYIFNHNIYSDQVFTKEERQDQKINTYKIKKKYHGLTNFYGIENFYFHSGLRFLSKKLLSKYSKKDVLDVGAANGDTAALFSREYAFKNIYAFEPEDKNYNQLINNIKLFKLQNVIGIKKGIGDRNKTVRITSEGGQSHISDNGSQKIQIITIDSFVKENRINVGLLKMDIEGFEYNAIVGAKKTIREQRPILLISIYHTGKDFFEIKPILEHLSNYTFMIRKLNPYHLFFDTVLIGIPKEK